MLTSSGGRDQLGWRLGFGGFKVERCGGWWRQGLGSCVSFSRVQSFQLKVLGRWSRLQGQGLRGDPMDGKLSMSQRIARANAQAMGPQKVIF